MTDDGFDDLLDGFRDELDPTITGVSLGVLAVFTLLRFTLPDTLPLFIEDTRLFLLEAFGPVFLGLMLLFVLFAVSIVVGPWGSIRLGGPEATPSYTYPAYFAMFFSAGIAAGIVFWGPAEALFHFTNGSAPFVGASPGSPGAVTGALKTVFFHWGVSAWSAYVAIGVPIAYFAYNEGAPLRVSSLLTPFVGKDRLNHPVAKLIDVLAIFATIGGVATSVGFVGQQFLSGVTYQWGVQTTALDTLIVIGGITVVFTVSVVTGVKRGIRRIAAINFGLFLLLGVATLVVGPTLFILSNGSMAFVGYAAEFVPMSFGSLAYGDAGGWFTEWTLFYWVWWFSWAPFAGLFLAAISKGRTLRTVTLTGVGATSLATLVWFMVIGGTSLQLQLEGVVDVRSIMSGGGREVAGFPLFGALPAGGLLVFLFMALIITFLVTSADTSTLTVSILATEQGVAPTLPTRVFWGVLQGAVGFGVVVVGGGGGALQSAAVITGAPFGIIALVGIVGLAKEFTETDVEGETVINAAQEAINNRSD